MRKTKELKRKYGRQLKSVILISLISCFFLIGNSCSPYRPELNPTYDVLNPAATVQVIGINIDGNIIVTPEFIIWVRQLQEEIVKLRKMVK
jgi:hypothetical protein